jgi:plastocyanin
MLVAILTIAAAVGGLFLVTRAGATSQTNCTTTSTVVAPTVIQVSIYIGAGNPSNKPGYSPDSITLVIGINNTVRWINDDSAAHTVTSTNAPDCVVFGSGSMNHRETYTITFNTPGTYHYRCDYHGWMTGTIVVKGP